MRRTSPYALTVEPVIHFCRNTGLPAMALRRRSAIAGNPVFLQAAYRIANHLLYFYRDSILATCETQRLPVSKPMSATQFSSMMNMSGVRGKGKQEIKKHLKAHLGQGFCPSRRCVGMLSEGHGVVNYGCINFTYKGKQQEEFQFRNREFVEKLSKARKMVTDQQLKLKTMRTSKSKVKDQQSIETKIFKVLKEIGVELSSYHGGSLNGKDI